MWKLKPLHANTARMTITQVGWKLVCHMRSTTRRPEELQVDPLGELSFFSLSFPSHGPSPIFPCDFQQKLLATANHLQADNYAEEYSC